MVQCAIAYYRVSTQRQGRSGLSIEAQRAAVARFAATVSDILQYQVDGLVTASVELSSGDLRPLP